MIKFFKKSKEPVKPKPAEKGELPVAGQIRLKTEDFGGYVEIDPNPLIERDLAQILSTSGSAEIQKLDEDELDKKIEEYLKTHTG